MKKLFAVLMIAGLFGFASCGNSEKSNDEAATTVDSAAVSTDQGTSGTAATETAPADSAAVVPDTTVH